MKRDLDLAIQILTCMEESKGGWATDPMIEDPNSTAAHAIGHHLEILEDAGLVIKFRFDSGGVPKYPVVTGNYGRYRLTWAGHEFLAATREPKVWNQIKQHTGRITFEALMRVATELGTRVALGQ